MRQRRFWGITPGFAFVADYNAAWRLEKQGFRSPAQLHATWNAAAFPVAA